VCPDRYLAGVLAERALGATVHVLDDGFQHVGLARNLDVLVTTIGEIPGGRVLPRGRLRESPEAAARAHVLVVMGATEGAAAAEAWTLGVSLSCGAARVLDTPRLVTGLDEPEARLPPGDSAGQVPRVDPAPAPGSRVVVACGIANPERFIGDVKAAGWQVAQEIVFADHHRFTPRDLERIGAAVAGSGAEAVFTTEKDAVRLADAGRLAFPMFSVPMHLRFEPPDRLFASVGALLPGTVTSSTAAEGA